MRTHAAIFGTHARAHAANADYLHHRQGDDIHSESHTLNPYARAEPTRATRHAFHTETHHGLSIVSILFLLCAAVVADIIQLIRHGRLKLIKSYQISELSIAKRGDRAIPCTKSH